MEGVLWKWTNYLSGWQPRWFILDNGVLSYYKSQEDVNNGCKGSIKMTVCDIVVHPGDMMRLDLIIPGEQHYYVKASTPQDRQSWLIALGSAKASFNDSSVTKKDADALPDQVRVKKSELRLYCDLLMQQAHSVKETVTTSNGQVDTDKLTESTSLIGATCDTFIATLEECMKLVSNTPMFESSHQHVRDSAIPSSPSGTNVHRLPGTRATITNRQPSERNARTRHNISSSADSIKIHRPSSTNHMSPIPDHSHSVSQSSTVSNSPIATPSAIRSLAPFTSASAPPQASLLPQQTPPPPPPPPPHMETTNGTQVEASSGRDDFIRTPTISNSGIAVTQVTPALSAATSSEDLVEDFKDAIDARISTFFSAMSCDFSHVDTNLPDGVQVLPFLDACRNIVPIFDKLNGTAFAPVKMDFSGNIKKIHQKQSSCPEKFTTLQSMIEDEIQNNQQTHANSATSALLWLKRSLEFIREFLREVCSGSLELSTCASNAYNRTLKNYHGWVVRGVFAVAVKALPYREVFITHLHCSDGTDPDISAVASRQFEHALLADIEAYIVHLDRVLRSIGDYYIQHSLDSDDRV